MELTIKTAAKLKAIREHKQISIESLAKSIGMKTYQLEMLEKGRGSFSIDILELLAKSLYIDVKIIFEVD